LRPNPPKWEDRRSNSKTAAGQGFEASRLRQAVAAEAVPGAGVELVEAAVRAAAGTWVAAGLALRDLGEEGRGGAAHLGRRARQFGRVGALVVPGEISPRIDDQPHPRRMCQGDGEAV